MPVPVSVTQSETYWPGGRSRSLRRALVEPPVRRLDGQPPAVRHGVAGVDAQVQERVLELVRVDQRTPTARPRRTTSTSIAGPTVRRISSSMPATSRLTSIGLGSSVWRREKASSRCVRAAARLRRAARRGDVALDLVDPALADARAQHLQAADDARQQVVEVVRDAAGELARPPPSSAPGAAPPRPPSARSTASATRASRVCVQFAQLGAGRLGRAPRLQELALVAPAVRGVEDGDADEARLAAGVSPLDGVDEDGQRRAVRPDEVERHLVEEALHAQQRREVGLVVDLARDVQQVLEAPPDELVPSRSRVQAGKRPVGLGDPPVRRRRRGSRRARSRRGPRGRPRARRVPVGSAKARASEEGLDGGDGLLGGAEVGAVAGRLHEHELAVRQPAVDVLAHRPRRDDVLGALEHEAARRGRRRGRRGCRRGRWRGRSAWRSRDRCGRSCWSAPRRAPGGPGCP